MDGTEGLPVTLARLADAAATGCLHVRGSGTARVHLRAGRLQAVALPAGAGARPLGARLLAAGLLTPAALAEAEEAQRSELQGWRLGELLVHLGHAEPAVVAGHVHDQLVDDLRTLLSTSPASTRFRPGERVRSDLAAPLDVRPLLAELGHAVGALPPAAAPTAPVPASSEAPAVPVTDAHGSGAPAEHAAATVADVAPVDPPDHPVTTPDPPADQPVPGPDARAPIPDAPTDAELAATNTRDFADAFASFGTPEPAPGTPPAASGEPAPDPEPSPQLHDPSWDRRDTDTAALLRELSSLGGAEPTPTPGPPPSRPSPPVAHAGSIAAQRKRKGLFGRV